MSGGTIAYPAERRGYFEDEDGAMAFTKTEDEVFALELDYTDPLEGETIVTSLWTDDGVATATRAISADTLKTTCLVSDTGGETVNTITTSGGRTLQRVVRFYAPGYQP